MTNQAEVSNLSKNPPNQVLATVRSQLARQKALAQVITRIGEKLELNSLFESTTTEVRQLLQVDRVAIFRFYPDSNWDQGEFVAEHVHPDFNSVVGQKLNDHCFGEQYAVHYAQGKVQAVGDIYEAGFSDCHIELLAQFQVRANLIVPLMQNEYLWGFLCIHHCLEPRHWQETDIEFVTEIANYLGVALQRAELIAALRTEVNERQSAERALTKQNKQLEETIQKLQEANQQLIDTKQIYQWQATHDALTELINRWEFEQYLEGVLKAAKTHQRKYVVAYLDLDKFKIVNDSCGHAAGDELLRQVGILLQSNLRKTDIAARLGGDEFAILFDQCSLEQATQATQRLCEAIEVFRFVWENNVFSIGVSIGVSLIDEKTPSVASSLCVADAACYAAKRQGGNRIHVYQADDNELTVQLNEMQLAMQIRKALEENCFQLYYQSIAPVDCKHTSTNRKFEILLRLDDGCGEVVSPGVFIPAAERYSLMHLVDRWVISSLLDSLKEKYPLTENSCQSRKIPNQYAVNLSGVSLNDEDLIDFVYKQFEIYKIPPTAICFEVTETAAIYNLSKAVQLINSLRSLGCQFALDDFGTGMSSFEYLKILPVDYLKIDGSFIKNLVSDPVSCAITESINNIAHLMELQTIAEYVEDSSTLTQISQLDVDYAQGYGIDKPSPLR